VAIRVGQPLPTRSRRGLRNVLSDGRLVARDLSSTAYAARLRLSVGRAHCLRGPRVTGRSATFATRCVVAREMRIYHTSTSSKPGRTKLYFGTTIYTDKKAHHRYRAWWWTLSEGWHRGWISVNPKYTDRRACGQIT